MKIKVGMLFLGSCLLLAAPVLAEEDSVYDIINHEDTVAFSQLVTLGYDIDDSDADGYTPLMTAATLGKPQFVQFLLDNGANVNRRSYNGETAVHRAAIIGNNEIINMLYEAGAILNMPDLDGNTPLMYAVTANRRFTVELLVKLGVDINFRNANNETALRVAEKNRFKEIAAFLRSKGAK